MKAASAVNIQIIRPRPPEEIAAVRELIQEYAHTLPVDLHYQNFQAEISNFPGAYSQPLGALFLALQYNVLPGPLALRPPAVDLAELQRLCVRPTARGHNLGRLLTEAA